MDKIVHCLLHGYAIGGGLQLALACDIRVGTRSVDMSLPAVTECLIPGLGTFRLARYIGVGRDSGRNCVRSRVDLGRPAGVRRQGGAIGGPSGGLLGSACGRCNRRNNWLCREKTRDIELEDGKGWLNYEAGLFFCGPKSFYDRGRARYPMEMLL